MPKPHSHQSQNTPEQPTTSSQQAKSRLHQLIEGSADPQSEPTPEPVIEPALEVPAEPTQAIASSRLKSLLSKSRPERTEPEVTTSKAKRKSKAKSAKPKHSIKVKLNVDSEAAAQPDAAPADTTAKSATEGATESATESATEAVNEPKVYPVVVYTPQELEQAHKDGAERIVVKGPLAKKLSTALKCLRSVGAPSYNTLALVLSGAALLSPFTGGVTVMGTLGAAVTAAAIAALSAIGLSLVIAVLKGYDEVKLGGGGVELVIKKKKEPEADAEPASSAAGAGSTEVANPVASPSPELKS